MIAILTSAAACCPVTSNCSAPPPAAHTHSQTKSDTAPCCSSESLGDKWSWVLTMAVILWRRWGTVSLYSAKPITGLLFACVSTQCNLKATPWPLGDTKWTACQSTGTPPKWIKVDYSGLFWPWRDVHTGFCSWRDKLNTVFYYRVTVKSVMYVNPSGIGKRRSMFWRDKMIVLREKERGTPKRRDSTEGKEIGSNGTVKETIQGRKRHRENDRKVTGACRNRQTEAANRGNRQREPG